MQVIKNGSIILRDNELVKKDILIDNGKILKIADNISEDALAIDATGLVIMPGMIDVHVHLREPGFANKETIATGTLAAIHGGYTSVMPMPNLNPVPCRKEDIKNYLELIKKNAYCNVFPYASITVDEKGRELTDFKMVKGLNINWFSDDGHGVDDDLMMEKALLEAKKENVLLACHTEKLSLLEKGASLHVGKTCDALKQIGISNDVEAKMIERDLILNERINAKYHVCHISSKESVDLIRKYKKLGFDVSAEATMHHLLLLDTDVKDTNYKMNPPLKSKEDRASLLDGIKDGTIEIIASDHAPHTEEEKNRPMDKAPFGIVGLETTLPLAYTYLVKKGIITLEKMVELCSTNPALRFGLKNKGLLKEGYDADLVLVSLDKEYLIDKASFKSKGKNTPFDKTKVSLKVVKTIVDGKIFEV